MTSLGYINWFNERKGFGLISSIEGDFFFHISNSPNLNTSNLKKESPVLYVGYINQTKNRAEAKKVHLLETMQDLKKIFKFWENVSFSSQVELLIIRALTDSLTYKSKISKEEFWSFYKQLIHVVEINKSNTIVRVVKNSITKELEEQNGGKLKEYLDVNLITNWSFEQSKTLFENRTISAYSSFCFCLKYISVSEDQHPESELTHLINNIFSSFDVVTVLDDLIRLIVDINEGNDLSNLNEHKNYICNDNYYKDLNGKELICAVNDFIAQELPSDEKINLYKKCYIYYLDENFLIDNISSFNINELKLLFNSTNSSSYQKYTILISKIKTLFYSNEFNLLHESICYAESIEPNWYDKFLLILKEDNSYKYKDLLINWYKAGHQRTYDEHFVKDNISLFSIDEISAIINKYNLNANQKEDLLLNKIHQLIEADFEDYKNGGSPLKYGTYKDIKEIISQYPGNKDYIVQSFIYYENDTSINMIVSLYKDGYYERLNHDFVISHIDRFETSDLIQIAEDSRVLIEQKIKILSAIFKVTLNASNIRTLKYINEKAEILLHNSYRDWMNEICSSISDDDLMLLWQEGMTNKIPHNTIKQILLTPTEDVYEIFMSWYNNGLLTQEQAVSYLWDNIEMPIDNLSRSQFYVVLYSISLLSKINCNAVNQLKLKQNKIFDLILWHLSLSNLFDFDILSRFFIYFDPKEQVSVIKRLFRMTEQGELILTIEMLESINRVDEDLYKLISQEHPLIPIDVSTEIIIKALSNLSNNGNFSSEKAVLDILINSGKYKTHFKIGDYFDFCKGRLIYKWNGYKDCAGVIQRINQSYFSVRIDINSCGWTTFEVIKNAIKNIPGRRWNPNQNYWEVPISGEASLKRIAIEYAMEIEGDKNNHMYKYKSENEGVPSGISYCEGRPAIKKDDRVDEVFLWCHNKQCFRDCIKEHDQNDWQNYTLLDFCRILKLNTDSIDSEGRLVKYGKYLTFASIINRANSILEHLYCKECGDMLIPVATSNYHTHIVTNFNCDNPNCQAYRQHIYISKCFNWKCHGIIDSRLTKKCPNDWHICPECGSCCSDRIFGQRNENRVIIGIGRSSYFDSMIGKGHLEKRQFFCSNCGHITNEIEDSVFQCPDCNKKYERKWYDYKPRYRTIPTNK